MNAIVLIIDKYYFQHACLLVASLGRNYEQHPDIVVFHRNLSTTQQRRLSAFKRVRLVDSTGLVTWSTTLMDAHRKMKVDSSIISARFLLWSNNLDDYDKVIYLDADTIVLGSMSELFDSDCFVMIRQPGKGNLLRKEKSEEVRSMLVRDGIEQEKSAGNSGVMMLPRRYRNEENLEQLLDINVRYHDHLKWQDQTTINLWCRKKNIELSSDYHYNYCIRSHEKYPDSVRREEIKVLHFNDMIENEFGRLRLMKEALNLKLGAGEVSRFLDRAYKSYKFGKSPGVETVLRVASWMRRHG